MAVFFTTLPLGSLGLSAVPIAGIMDLIIDIIAPLLPFILMILYVVAQVLGRQSKQSKQRGGRAQQPRRVPQRPMAQGPGGAPNPADEVEEFLRRVAQRRAGGRPADVEVLRPPPPPPEQKTRRLVPERPQKPRGAEPEKIHRKPLPSHEPKKQPTVSAELAEEQTTAEPPKPRRRKRPSASRPHAKRPDESAVTHAVEQIEQHVHTVFDHQLGHLSSRLPEIEDVSLDVSTAQRRRNEAEMVAQGLIQMLTTPRDLRRAIIFHEIFDRPVDRWRDNA